MSISLRKAAAMQLEAEYAQLRKQQAEEKANKPKRTRIATVDAAAAAQTDTVTLSSTQAEGETPAKPKPSQPVSTAEKSALHSLFSVSA
ncbi:hypothetical protein [Geobacter sp. AOG2]|uniref:hypothetical protein n=1 Tax=Geobacter sp. AOG2 TaxID=1566347 RepID=UPI001CC3E0A1|nr:hypothetical protein [Geobacter sp. AOG2]GFE61947.1 hypothetical protein AOG2_25350 [Geobacter sp. AOG2]